ncbi:MAG TPA: DNA gyrase subunit A [Stellaceae bacterium]|nr:DNA gyrase subunit A [Stellaceae bacterium]
MATEPPAPAPLDIAPVTIEEEMKRSYLDYAMSVIVARALPDVRDGLKPVHRRILHSMKENGFDWNRGFRKSARVVGDVIGKYHPHGDLAVYEAMVRMAQGFSMRVPLIDGQGNFGSMDGDPPAAMRYTESRLSRAADSLLDDLDKDTVDFSPNYDGENLEPKVLPARFPNLLVNGASGIAVGMATNIPTHNLGEVIDACCAYVGNPDITIDELTEIVPGPDFPTGGIILGRTGIRAAYHTGRGSIVMRGRTHIEENRRDREAIIITEVPFQVNKARLVERIAEVVNEKLIDGISDLRDESDRDGVRVVIELKRDAMSEIVLNQLYRYTALQTSFGVNMLALNGGRPEMLNLKQVIAAFIEFREQVITRRTVFLLSKARERAHVLLGLAVAVSNIDAIIEVIRRAKDPTAAREGLRNRAWPMGAVKTLIERVEEKGRGGIKEDGASYRLSDEQAKAILELRLQRLTGLERDKIAEEIEGLINEIGGYLEILGSRKRLLEVLNQELLAMKEQFATPRKTAIEDMEFETDIEDLIQREDMVVTVSHGGYIKRVPLSTYRAQRRGGRGRAGMSIREEDFVSEVFVASTHASVLFFTASGRVYKLKVYKLPEGTPQARGKAMVNLLPNLAPGESISAVLPLPEDEASWGKYSVMFATAKGNVRRNALSDFGNVMANGKMAMKFEGDDADDRLIAVATCTANDDVLLASRLGKAIRFPVEDVRLFSGRSSVGVRGIKLAEGDSVISMTILRHEEVAPETRDAYLRLASKRRRQMGAESDVAAATTVAEPEAEGEVGSAISEEEFDTLAKREEFLLSITEKGFGVRSSAYDYRITGRGGQGIENMDLARRGDAIVAVFPVQHRDQVMLVSNAGTVIRLPVNDIRIARRRTQGVVVFKPGEGERVVSAARLGETADVGGNGDAGANNGMGEGGTESGEPQ